MWQPDTFSWDQPLTQQLLPTFTPAVHDALDPEMSILKQRIARRLRHEGYNDNSVKDLTLGGCLLWCGNADAAQFGALPAWSNGLPLHPAD